jgi:hypothetical protein
MTYRFREMTPARTRNHYHYLAYKTCVKNIYNKLEKRTGGINIDKKKSGVQKRKEV